ncbi:MAG: hypothetical protein SVO96_11530 [Pseudomonadota bacterium]|nr:hypothetical protein [Pseudomonadota bacterium]
MRIEPMLQQLIPIGGPCARGNSAQRTVPRNQGRKAASLFGCDIDQIRHFRLDQAGGFAFQTVFQLAHDLQNHG